MRRQTAGSAIILTTALVIAGTAVPASAATDPFAAFAGQEVTWGPCAFTTEPGTVPVECATITVARDWAAPGNGRTLQVSISRVAASGEKLGSLLINPGGPGGQGTSLPGYLAAIQPALHERYALIGMDPRGTGQEGGTTPEMETCEVPIDRLSTRTDLDARDRSARSIAEHHKLPRAIAEACQSEALAPYITTWQTAHDMELIRILLDESRLDYLGYSYGTWLGAKYASLFPGSAGKMVLDSSTNFQGRLQAAFEAWPPINQRLFGDQFLPWMTRQFPEIAGTTTEEAAANWERGRAYFAANGVSPDDYDASFVGLGSEFAWVLAVLVFAMGVSGADGEAPELAGSELAPMLDARSRAVFGVPLTGLTPAVAVAALADDPADYALAPTTRFAVACGDQPTRSVAWYKRLSDEQGPQFPLFGWQYGIGEACAFWSDAPRQQLPQLPAEVSGRVLVVQGEFDPQTGYEQARSAVRAAPGVSLVSVDDSPFHGQYAFQGNPCVDGMVNVFLLHNSRPGTATCPGLPLPGETAVFPVAGPVRTPAPARAAAAEVAPLAELRASVQERISAMNRLG
ncbi:pimeloyl-ACP methyl ester carboxylesterase [Catenuloplanes nepalensis]|uniref:Pimeloyl-ACP methyl ester carboxylesterase n=1 Tax=Catenuloplanes nepalensis TaxID=587533 RepID=A0ABT9MUD8_9ACTN|nr:alpha/beta hydrolase [Catenuloplanes nepalensis]MDP9795068.1 pimeloyl-ACP methyl ester carboxylesterase [Catenuloplanes nepalensis]